MIRPLLLLLGLSLLLALPLAAERPDDELHQRAAELVENEEWDAACKLLREHLSRSAPDAEAHLLLGRALLALKEKDEASHHLEAAVKLLEAGGGGKQVKLARRDLVRADSLNGRRERFFRDLTSKLYKAAEQLFENGHPERSLDLLRRLAPCATGKDAKKAATLREKVQAAFEKVDLDAASGEREEGGSWPLVTLESEHYRLEANLEPELVQLVADTMDDLHGYYVLLYLDGDEKAASSSKATIRIHPDKDSMLDGWGGASTVEGWWSPGQNQVTCYDTRTTRGSLDWMLTTLFHEASHQFMTMLERRGGWSPAWLNEGTATFFEGATAMADHRVLWPDAAIGRLRGLAGSLESGRGPTPVEVVGYGEAGSYPGEYYAFGWGLVYFMQQYEDPVTLEYVYRPLYSRYREEVTTRGGDSMELFEEVFLGQASPLGHETFAEFEKDWKRWILEEVKPLHVAPKPERRELRRAHVDRYLAAAREAEGKRKAPVSEAELLTRALGHVEYIRSRIDGEEHPDAELILLQVEINEALGRPASAAPLVEILLDLADDGAWAPEPEQYEALEKHLRDLDRRNWALRRAQSASRGLARTSRKLLEEYQESDPPMLLRAYTLAAQAGRALADDDVLLPAAAELRGRVREAGLLAGAVHTLVAPRPAWMTIYNAEAKSFRLSPEFISLEGVRPTGYLNTAVEVGDEYELRATFRREGELYMSTCHGLVIAGVKEGDWLVFGLLAEGKAGLWRLKLSSGGGVTTKKVETFYLDPTPADDEDLAVRVHVTDGRDVEIDIEGQEETIYTSLPEDLPDGRYVGVYVKDGTTKLEMPVVELYP